MNPIQFQIDNMPRGGCAKSVTEAIHSVGSQEEVDIDLTLKHLDVQSGADESAVVAVIKDFGVLPCRAA